MTSRKDYKAIAEVIKKGVEVPLTSVHTFCKHTMQVRVGRDIGIGLADYFTTDNPRFDYTKFMVACGLE